MAVLAERQIERDIFDAIFQKREPAILVKSPPGAGKTHLIESIGALASLEFGRCVALTTPKREQAYDVVVRLRQRFPQSRVELFCSKRDILPQKVLMSGAQVTHDATALRQDCGIVVCTVDKFTHALPRFQRNQFTLVVIDEAYQARVAQALGAIGGNWQIVLVGDPGQLRPFSDLPDDRFESATEYVHWALPAELLRRFPTIPTFGLPVTRRLPPDTVPYVRPFYPDLAFEATARDDERRVKFGAGGIGGIVDRALDAVAQGASMIMIALPPLGYKAEVDPELSALAARVAKRFLERGAYWDGERPLSACDIGYCDTHVVSGTETRAALRHEGVDPAFADTPEIIQGREAPIVIIKHPLSGLVSASAFDVEPGRLCVMLSRHKLACIVLTRADLPNILGRYEHDSSQRRAGRHDDVWDGYVAHRDFYRLMQSQGRIIT